MKKLIIAVLVMSWASPVWASFIDGNTLYSWCQEEKSSNIYFQMNARCVTYIIGVSDAVSGSGKGIGGFNFCLPKHVSTKQVRDIVDKWLGANPQDRHYDADSLVASVLYEVWPCPE